MKTFFYRVLPFLSLPLLLGLTACGSSEGPAEDDEYLPEATPLPIIEGGQTALPGEFSLFEEATG